MSKMTYKCNFCEHDFKQKVDLDRHLKKKNGCIPINKIIDMKEQQNITNNKISELHSLFKTCLDILRNDAEHLIGDEALNELSYFLILKQLEKHIINNSIDIYNLELYHDGIKKYGKEKFIEQLEYIKFTKLVEYVKIAEKENNIKNIFDNFLWKEILSKHPKFKDIFEDGKKSFIKESSTIKKIIITLSNVDFDNYEHDILGEAYERIFVDAVFGAGGNKKSEMGQFFTPTKVKKLLVSLVNPKVKENGEIESVLDPSSGTGGILNTVIKYFKKNNKISNEDLRKQLINNIYGIEIKGKIYNLCLSNMLINTGEILPNVICADSIRKFHNIKVDTIIANPPFSVSISYDELLSSLESVEILDDYIPIKAGGKNSEVLFLQMMIHCLNINGRCATVMLDGQKMYGDTSGYDKIREYLMKSCDLHEVILCPAGTFTSTASKTCILFFTKKKERKDILEIKGSKRELIFSKVHSTKKVTFYDFNPDTEEKHFIKEVDIKEIASKKYSLNYTEYNVEEDECKDEEHVKWLELNEVCKIKYGDRIVKKNTTSGEYDVYGGGDKTFTTDTFNREGYNILIARFALSKLCVRLLNKKFYLNDSGLTISINKEYGNNNYIGYYLVFNQYLIYNLARGTGQKNLDMENFKKIKIPIISIEKQNKIIDFLDKLYENKQIKIQDTVSYYKNNNIFKLLLDEKYDIFEKLIEWQEQSVELLKQIEFLKNRQDRYFYLSCKNKNIIFKKLNEICDEIKSGKYNSKDCNNVGKYPFYTSKVNNPEGFCDNFCFDYENYLILIKDGGAGEGNYGDKIGLGKVFRVSGKTASTTHQLAIVPNNNINCDYLYYYLQSQKNKIMDMAKYTIGLGCIKKTDLEKIKIPIPPINKQNEIVEYCDNNKQIIIELLNNLNNNNKLAIQFIKDIVDESNEESNEESNNESNEESNEESNDEIQIIILKNTEYYLINDEVYTIKNNNKDKLYGYYKNNKVKKI